MKVGILILFMILERFLFLTIEYNVSCAVFIIAFIILRNFPSIPCFWEFLSWKDIEFCQVPFLYLLRDSYGFLSFILKVCCITLIDTFMLNRSSIPGVNPTWSWCILFLICLLNCVCSNFVEDVCIYIYKKYYLWYHVIS